MNFIKKVLTKEDYKNDETYKELYNELETHLEYPSESMSELVGIMAKKHPYTFALDYYGRNMTYSGLYERIKQTAKALKVIGVKENERVTICMPNTPEAIVLFYAINMIGAVASMIHPLSSVNEIEFYMDAADSKYILTVNLFADKVIEAARKVKAKKIIISDITDGMFGIVRAAKSIYDLYQEKVRNKANTKYTGNDIITWTDFVSLGSSYNEEYMVHKKPNEEAVILYSGGTTGKPKGVCLSNMNFNALGIQSFKATGAKVGDSILVILPIFHGFGLGVSVHTGLINGMKCVLVPKFNIEDFSKLIKRHKPIFLTGVPTMYEALTKIEDNSKFLKCVKNVICGGDLLQPALRDKVNEYLAAHGSSAQIRVGYGLTESTAACILTPNYYFKEGGIGIPFPDVEVKIFKPGTNTEVRNGKEGEICISGPTVMIGYLNEPEETANTLTKDKSGRVWLHTGDLGYKDKDGLVFFTSRLKRMIITSGYNIYPTFMEKIITAHPAIEACVVVGIPHPYKKQVPVACIVLRDNFTPSNELTEDIKAYCAKSIAKYSMPYRYEFIKAIPKTLIGKVNFKKLEKDCTRKYGKK